MNVNEVFLQEFIVLIKLSDV